MLGTPLMTAWLRLVNELVKGAWTVSPRNLSWFSRREFSASMTLRKTRTNKPNDDRQICRNIDCYQRERMSGLREGGAV